MGGGDSIIKIIDTSSMVDGKNFTFEFARQNRKPSLDYLRLNAKYGEDYDVYVYENEPFILRPEGYDPDEDDLVYKYSGWKVEPNNNVWESSDIYLNASDVSDAYCSHPFYGLTNSRCANYRPTREDIGPHVLTITSIDSGGKSDYQFVKIFVDDIPNASFVVHSIYDDIPNFTVSKEDPVIFDARESIDRVKPFPTSMMEYRWVNDPSNPAIEKGFPYSRNLRPSYFAVPSIPASGFNFNNLYGNPYILDDSNNAINTYTNYLKDKDSLLVETHAPFGFPGAIDTIKTLLTLNLYIDGKQSGEPYRHEVYNAQCLPHRSEVPAPLYDDFINDFVDVPNTIDGLPDALNPNIFLANHTCCIGNPNGQPNTWAIAPIGTVCYNFTDYGKYHEFISGAKRIEGLSSPSGDSPPPVGNTDTYERKIIGKCTGDRGNVCKLAVNSLKKAPFYSKILGDGSNPFNGIDAVCAEFNCSSNFVYVDSSDVSSGITRYYISPMIDAGFDTVLYEKIKYSLLIPIEVFDSVVCLKIASASDSVDLPVVINPPMGDIQFTGPRGTTEDDDCYSSDDFISSNHDNNRYIKILFRMAISFGTLIDSPSLNSVEISYKEAQ